MTTADERPEELHECPTGALASAGDAETIAVQVGRCPSGALQIRR